MAKSRTLQLLSDEIVIEKIHIIRDQKVMLDKDLAALYKVETKRLKEAVRRNIARFPANFMFELTIKELASLRTQNATSKGGNRYLSMAFTEQGVAMLSSVLNSETAIAVNIQISVFLLVCVAWHRCIRRSYYNLRVQYKKCV